MSFSTYAKQSWTNGSGGGTALSATRMGHLEDGLAAASASFNVLAYGAVGDGSTNDTLAVQAALDAVGANGGGTLVFPPATYNINGAVRASANTTIYAYGATIRQIGDGGMLYNFKSTDSVGGYAGRGNIAVLGGTWDNNAADGSSGTVSGAYNALFFQHASDITVRDVTVLNVSSSHALEFNAIQRGRIENCRFLGFRDNTVDSSRPFSEAIQIDLATALGGAIPLNDNTPCADITVIGCYSGASTRLGSWGRLVGNHSHTGTAPHTGITVANNRINSPAREGINAMGWSRAVITGNTIVGAGAAGIAVVTISGTPLYSITVTDNIVEGSAGPAVSVTGLSDATITEVLIAGNTSRAATGSAIAVTYTPGARIIGNTIKSPTTGGVSVTLSDNAAVGQNTVRSIGTIGVYMAGCAGGVVSANMIDTSGSYGVNLDATGGVNDTDCMVTGNVIRASTTAGVRLSAGALGTTVTANQIRKGTGTTAGGVSVAAAATGAVVVGNDLSGNAWTAAAAVAISTGAATKVDYAGGTTVPGHNLI